MLLDCLNVKNVICVVTSINETFVIWIIELRKILSCVKRCLPWLLKIGVYPFRTCLYKYTQWITAVEQVIRIQSGRLSFFRTASQRPWRPAAPFPFLIPWEQARAVRDGMMNAPSMLANLWEINKLNEIMPCAATGMDLEITILSEVSQTEKDRYHMTSLMYGL